MLPEIEASQFLSYGILMEQKPGLAAPAGNPQTRPWGALVENILLRLLGSQSKYPGLRELHLHWVVTSPNRGLYYIEAGDPIEGAAQGGPLCR